MLRDLTFLKNDFPSKGEIKKEEYLFELDGKIILDESIDEQEKTLPSVVPKWEQFISK